MNWRERPDWRVYLVTDRELCLGRPLEDVVLRAVAGGATMVQLREKEASSRDFLALTRLLVRELHGRGGPLVVNDRADIALAGGAAGLHVGQSDLPPADARALMGPDALIGLSVENMAQLEAAQTWDVDYLGISPVWATPTKTDTAEPWGLDGLAEAGKRSRLPLVAIGGIHAGNAAEVIAAGADGLAVVSEICSAPDPEAAARFLRGLFRNIPPFRPSAASPHGRE